MRKLWGGWNVKIAFEQEDFFVGQVVLTPSGRRAVVVKLLTGSSKFDCFSRIQCRYEGGKRTDLVTLQPHQLRPAPAPEPVCIRYAIQLPLFA